MQLVTDRAADLSPEQLSKLTIDLHYLPLTLSLDGKDYISGVDIDPDGFYSLLEKTDGMPKTSLPSPGEVEQIYRDIVAKTGDKDILSVHISQNLSGTFNSVVLAARAVAAEGINVTTVDSRTLSGALGWQVEAAARGLMAGWDLQKIIDTMAQISKAADSIYTLPQLKYLIHGGRISHMTGLIASTLGIKPIIGVNYDTGKYDQRGRVRTFKKAVAALADTIASKHAPGSKLRIQPVHARNTEAMQEMVDAIKKQFDVVMVPSAPIAPVLGAHTGAGMVGVAFAQESAMPVLP